MWRSNFHRSVYRVLTAGALLARAYYEPFLSATVPADAPPNFLRSFLHGYRTQCEDFEAEDDRDEYPWFSAADIAYLVRFPAYDFAAGVDSKNPAFSEFARWLVGGDAIELPTSRATTTTHDWLSANEFSDQQRHLILEITRLVYTLEHVRVRFCNGDGMPLYGRPGTPLDEPTCLFVVEHPSRWRNATVILPGVFRVEVVTMPEQCEQASKFFLIANPAIPARQDDSLAALPSAVDIPRLLELIYYRSGLPNSRGHWPAPAPALYPFEFALQKYLALRFKDNAFEARRGGPFERFLDGGATYVDEKGKCD